MTEAKWWTCTNPEPMLWHLGIGDVSLRKLRLFAIACARRRQYALHYGMRRDADALLTVAERFAEGTATEDERPHAVTRVNILSLAQVRGLALIEAALQTNAYWGACAAVRQNNASALCPLLRDIFGNPFRVTQPTLTWFTPLAQAIADQIYQERDFAALPVLADVLEEAGCTEPDLLDHCRSATEHVRGCWVIDVLLGKE